MASPDDMDWLEVLEANRLGPAAPVPRRLSTSKASWALVCKALGLAIAWVHACLLLSCCTVHMVYGLVSSVQTSIKLHEFCPYSCLAVRWKYTWLWTNVHTVCAWHCHDVVICPACALCLQLMSDSGVSMGMRVLRGPVRSLLVAMLLGFGGGATLSTLMGSRPGLLARAPLFSSLLRRLSPSSMSK